MIFSLVTYRLFGLIPLWTVETRAEGAGEFISNIGGSFELEPEPVEEDSYEDKAPGFGFRCL